MEKRGIESVRPFARDYLPETNIEEFNKRNTAKNKDQLKRINEAKERLARKQESNYEGLPEYF
jgi:hypothetical protein